VNASLSELRMVFGLTLLGAEKFTMKLGVVDVGLVIVYPSQYFLQRSGSLAVFLSSKQYQLTAEVALGSWPET